jgi:hypothetical protein
VQQKFGAQSVSAGIHHSEILGQVQGDAIELPLTFDQGYDDSYRFAVALLPEGANQRRAAALIKE